MSPPPADESTTTAAFDVLADSRRRQLLAVLLEEADPTTSVSLSSSSSSSSSPSSPSTPSDSPSASIPIETLATEVTSKLHDRPIVTDDQCERTHIALVHIDLPRLEEAGLVAREPGETTTVSPTDHPLLETEWVRTLLETSRDGGLDDEEQLNRTLEVLQSPRRRAACVVLARRRGTVPVADLAALIAAREDDRRLVDVDPEACTPVETDLVHSHLPALTDVGLVAFDRDERTVALEADASLWRTDWLAASPLGEIADRLETSPESSRNETPTREDGGTEIAADATRADSCWTIEGAETIVARGHEIADSATEELFVTVPDDGLLQQRCLERWRDATDRGVDVCVGSRSPQIRDIVRAAVPDATVCKPQLDWLNFPTDQLHHGRVVFADRERVMLVTIDDDPSQETLRATAITGEGRENALVSLVREHVGPRLDRLDRLESDRDDRERTDGTPSSLPM